MPVKFTPELIPRYDQTLLRYLNENFLRLRNALEKVAVETVTAAAPTSPYEGQEYLNTSNNVKYIYLGGIWIPVAHLGAPFSYNPVWVQTNVITYTVTEANYVKEGRKVTVWILLSATSAGVINTVQTLTIPVTAAIAANKAIGTGYFYDAGTNVVTPLVVTLINTTTVQFKEAEVTSGVYLGAAGSANPQAVAAADALTCCFTYLAVT